MPASTQGVRNRAKSEKYLSRPKLLGKGLEYAVSSFPAVTQNWLRELELASARSEIEGQNIPIVPLEKAHNAINRIAANNSLEGTIAAFDNWIRTIQLVAFTHMEKTTGPEFSESCFYFDMATSLIRMLDSSPNKVER